MAYAIIKTGGKQYRVSQGDVIDVEKLNLEAGAQHTFSDVLFVGEGADFKIGGALSGVSVLAEVVDQRKAPKVIAWSSLTLASDGALKAAV